MSTTLSHLSKNNRSENDTPTKTCSDCKTELPLKSFHKNGNMKAGHSKRCIECEKKRVKLKEGSPEYKKHFFVHDNFYL